MFQNRIDKIIHDLGNYIPLTEDDIDYLMEYYPEKIKEVLLKSSQSIKALMLLNEFLIKEMD